MPRLVWSMACWVKLMAVSRWPPLLSSAACSSPTAICSHALALSHRGSHRRQRRDEEAVRRPASEVDAQVDLINGLLRQIDCRHPVSPLVVLGGLQGANRLLQVVPGAVHAGLVGMSCAHADGGQSQGGQTRGDGHSKRCTGHTYGVLSQRVISPSLLHEQTRSIPKIACPLTFRASAQNKSVGCRRRSTGD